ncbi:MAG: VCBS repeat-containing protein [Bacteroidales bacterium]|jgi:hypothetical protein|nr:VCBS repeat-containing protein [Bacteroidales bacterium]
MKQKKIKRFLLKEIPKITAILILLSVYWLAQPSYLSKEEHHSLSSLFDFEKYLMYFPDNLKPEFKRNVHPQYKKIESWISSVGSSVAFFDFDEDNLQNDLVNIDTRFGAVYISPAPGTEKRFESFELKVKKLRYDKNKMAPNGLVINDFNEDGKTDIMVLYLGRTPIIFYNCSNGIFEESELTTEDVMWDSTTGIAADFNGDGHSDLFIGNYFPDTTKMIYADATDKNQVMMNSMSRGNNGAKNRMFIWSGIESGKAVFSELKDWYSDFTYPNDWTLAVSAADLNGDMLPELYISNDFGPDKLLLNTSKNGEVSFKQLFGKKKFNTTRSNVLGQDSYKGMGADFNDMNNDGLFDIYVSNLADTFALFESHFLWINNGKIDDLNKGIACFENESEKYGLSRSSWGWDSKLGDFNNDGTLEAVQATGFFKGTTNRWPELQELAEINDFFVDSPDRWPQFKEGDDLSGSAHLMFFVKSSSGRYYDISESIGLGENLMTRGIALSDIDHDGRLDMAVSSQWENSYLYKNIGSNKNSFLGLSIRIPIDTCLDKILLDTEPIKSRDAIGTIARINLENGKKSVKMVDGGNGFSGINSKEILFGLNSLSSSQTVDVELMWLKSDHSVNSTVISLLPGWHTIYLPF